MVNDVRYYFIDICLCLYLENDESKTLPVTWTKTLTKIGSIVCDHFQNNWRVFNGLVLKSQKIVTCELSNTIHAWSFFAFDELFS